MGERLEVDWTDETITSEKTWNLCDLIAKQLSGLVLHEHDDGRLPAIKDYRDKILHVAYNIGGNNWTCFCRGARDGEYPATTCSRVRLMKDLEGAE
jgi:hypothetical protein